MELHGISWGPSDPGTPTSSAFSSDSSDSSSQQAGFSHPVPNTPSFALPPSPWTSPAASVLTSNAQSGRPSLRLGEMERRGSCDLFECVELHKHFSEAQAKMIFGQIGEYDMNAGFR